MFQPQITELLKQRKPCSAIQLPGVCTVVDRLPCFKKKLANYNFM